MTQLTLTNTLTRTKEVFTPIDATNVRMYVCGVTPYDHSHIGHARAYVTFDILYRLLRHLYGPEHVTYVRNFTDIDDKIIARANETGADPRALSEEFIASYHEDMAALNCLPLPPEREPKVSDPKVIQGIIDFIQNLMAPEKDAAYKLEDGVYLDISKIHGLKNETEAYEYGCLSGKKLDELQAGARVDVKTGKRNPGDFALWKFSKPEEPAGVRFAAPWGEGRPGWHIECSVMSEQLLGNKFDIHGGGEDLQFPHHENELAQSVCCHGHTHADFWMHNAFITVEGRKMSKSLGNFVTIKDVLQKYSGEAIRLWLLQTHYRKPVDYSEAALDAAETRLRGLYQKLADGQGVIPAQAGVQPNALTALMEDLNTPQALAGLEDNLALAQFLGLLQMDPDDYLKGRWKQGAAPDDAAIDVQITARNAARAAKDWAESDRIRDALKAQGIVLEDGPTGTTWRRA